jgi:hypothetical protein
LGVCFHVPNHNHNVSLGDLLGSHVSCPVWTKGDAGILPQLIVVTSTPEFGNFWHLRGGIVCNAKGDQQTSGNSAHFFS